MRRRDTLQNFQVQSAQNIQGGQGGRGEGARRQAQVDPVGSATATTATYPYYLISGTDCFSILHTFFSCLAFAFSYLFCSLLYYK